MKERLTQVIIVALLSACGDAGIGLALCDPFGDTCDPDQRCAAVFEFDAADEVVDSGFYCVLTPRQSPPSAPPPASTQ